MDMNEYCLQMMTRQRLQEMRAEGEAIALCAAACPRTPLRVAVGQALVRLGNRLLKGVTPVHATARPA
jgi:hypothetical protein